MMIYEVIPHEGVGPVRLGMSREESRAAMNSALSSSREAEDYGQAKDSYHANAFQVFFDKESKVEYIELSKQDSFKAIYKGVYVHETKADKLLEILSENADFDRGNRELGYSYIFPALQLSVWRSVLPEDDREEEGSYFMTIGIGIKNYYSPGREEAVTEPR